MRAIFWKGWEEKLQGPPTAVYHLQKPLKIALNALVGRLQIILVRVLILNVVIYLFISFVFVAFKHFF